MGWDAFTNATQQELDEVFEPAAHAVFEQTGAVDSGLAEGWLDCSECARALENATGLSCWDKIGWDEEKVKELAKSAKWPELPNKDGQWAVLSAKAFLDCCAKTGLAIEFSF